MDQGRSSTLYIFMLQKPAQALAGFATLDKYRVKFFTNPSLFPCRFVTWRMLIHLVSTLESPLLLLQVRHLPIQNTTCCALVLSRLSDILELLENVTYSMLLIQNLKRFVFFFYMKYVCVITITLLYPSLVYWILFTTLLQYSVFVNLMIFF